MKVGRSIGLSVHALFAHKLRAALAMSGVAIGVAAVLVTSSLAKGAERALIGNLASMGTNLLIVKPVPVRRLVARKEVAGLATSLTLDDYEAMTRLGHVSEAAPGIDGPARAKAGNRTVATTVRGTTTAFLHVRQFTLRAGRFLDADDNNGARRVAVLGSRVAENLFPAADAIGQPIRIRGVPFDVIGVLEARGVLADGDQDNQIVVPVRTALRRLFNITWLSEVFIGVESTAHLNSLQSELKALLVARHSPDARGEPDFAIQDPARPLSAQKRTADSLAFVTTLLASLGLLVGGAGILALMLLSVKERTSEIGLRMAVGARPRDIVVQFLIEATCLALGGWIAGVAVGALAGTAIAIGTQWALDAPLDVLAASLAMAVAIGLGFGVFPARRAAMVPPIQALLVK